MELTRTIHPVGQGGFYTESLKDDNGKEFLVAYDCGGNNKQFMEDYLESFIHNSRDGSRMVIDAVFISHLHADHVNGLKYLLDNAYVKYLFLPQITDEMLIEVLLYNCHINKEDYQKLSDFIFSIRVSIREGQSQYRETKIVEVLPAINDYRVNVESNNDIVNLTGNGLRRDKINSGTIMSVGATLRWLYIPYNPRVREDEGVPFSTYLEQRLGIPNLRPDMLPDIVTKFEKDIKQYYAEYFNGNHNSYSMTLFSGLRNPDCYHFDSYHRRCIMRRHCSCDSCCCRRKKCIPNCLYTGDFEPTYINDLKGFYNGLWDTISSIQVPHHGSRNNYHPVLYTYACKGFISVGTRNRYHHPNTDTLINIHRDGCCPIIVTEDPSTMYVDCFVL